MVEKTKTVDAKMRMPTKLAEWCTRKAKEKGMTFNGWMLAKLWAEYEEEKETAS